MATFAYPYGQHNKRVREVAARRFSAAFTTDKGLNSRHTNPACLRRAMVLPDDTMPNLFCLLHFGYNPLRGYHFGLRLRSRFLRCIEPTHL